MKFLRFSQTKLGSSLLLPAHGRVEARATSFLAAHFALQNTLSNSAEKKASPSEGEAEGGCGGNSASPEPKRSPAALLVRSRAQQKSFLFLLEEKIGRAQNKKYEENFFAGWRALASGDGAERQSSQSGFSSKKVRILTKRHRQFSKFGFWAIVASPSLRSGSAETRILYGFLKSQNNFCPLKRKFGLPKANINLKNLSTNLFSFAFSERQSDNLILTAK